MAAISAAAVVVTLIALVVPIYLQNRSALTALHAERLLTVARSAAVTIPPEPLDVIARGDAQGGAASDLARQTLKQLWVAGGGNAIDHVHVLTNVRPRQ